MKVVEPSILMEERSRYQKELNSCDALLQRVKKMSQDYAFCEEKLSQIINYLSEGCIIDGVGVGYNSLNMRKEKMLSDMSTIESTVTFLINRKRILSKSIGNINRELAGLSARKQVRLNASSTLH